MARNGEGLTKTYNRFHVPEETAPDIIRLRELHVEMDRAVLDAYGWNDIPTECEFLLDYDDEDDDDESKGNKRKRPWRYRWPDLVRDEVLARLLKLNKDRHDDEVRSGRAKDVTPPNTQKEAKKKRAPKGVVPPQSELLPTSQGELFE